MKNVIVIVGPTGVGKTKMSVQLAKRLHGQVISGDSMQIYKEMDIGTAKVTKEEMEDIIHYNVDIREPEQGYSVAEFQSDIRTYIDTITAKGCFPIIAGGTGLYIKGALYDYIFNETEDRHDYYSEKYKDYTNIQLHDYLRSFDPKSADALHPNNRRRVLRAIEIYEETGETKGDTLDKQEHKSIYHTYFVGLTLEREVLYERINQRVDKMIEAGLEQEVRKLYDQGLTLENQSMKAIGYKEWFAYFEGNSTLEDTIALIKKNSRNYAKRQYTWFKNQFDVHWYTVNLDDFDETIETVYQDILSYYEMTLK